MRVLALIPARGGSKRLPRKNIRELCGKPLIAWTIETANQSKLITETWVSTEDMEIAQISKDWGAKVLHRPSDLARDDTSTIDVVNHAIGILPQFDYVCLLQPTSPLRTVEDVDECIKHAFELGECVSCEYPSISNGAVYVFKPEARIPNSVFRIIPHCVDIDTEADFMEAEALLKARLDR